MTETSIARRDAFIAGLRACADFLEAHPELRTPENQTLNVWNCTKEDLTVAAKTSSWEKVYAGTLFYLTKSFGEGLTLEYNTPRETVCRKVVKGTIIIPARPEQEVEDVEWVCDDAALLGGASS